jgi:hypothetical protein
MASADCTGVRSHADCRASRDSRHEADRAPGSKAHQRRRRDTAFVRDYPTSYDALQLIAQSCTGGVEGLHAKSARISHLASRISHLDSKPPNSPPTNESPFPPACKRKQSPSSKARIHMPRSKSCRFPFHEAHESGPPSKNSADCQPARLTNRDRVVPRSFSLEMFRLRARA